MNLKKFLFPILILLFPVILMSQDVLNYQNSLKFANHLFFQKDYKLAAIEYKRISYLEPNDTLAKLRVVQSYRLMNDITNAKLSLNQYFPDCKACTEVFAIENFRILFMSHQYADCYRFLLENKTIAEPEKTEFETGTLLMLNKWKDAQAVAENFIRHNPATAKISSLYDVSLKGNQLKYKNPFCAALLSGIVPGSGKVYTGQWKDGIYAFLAVGSLSWLTYSLIKDKGINARSIISGSLALSFYTANIWGAFKSAKKYNYKINNELTKDVEKILIE